jgi:hypothetical protein
MTKPKGEEEMPARSAEERNEKVEEREEKMEDPDQHVGWTWEDEDAAILVGQQRIIPPAKRSGIPSLFTPPTAAKEDSKRFAPAESAMSGIHLRKPPAIWKAAANGEFHEWKVESRVVYLLLNVDCWISRLKAERVCGMHASKTLEKAYTSPASDQPEDLHAYVEDLLSEMGYSVRDFVGKKQWYDQYQSDEWMEPLEELQECAIVLSESCEIGRTFGEGASNRVNCYTCRGSQSKDLPCSQLCACYYTSTGDGSHGVYE